MSDPRRAKSAVRSARPGDFGSNERKFRRRLAPLSAQSVHQTLHRPPQQIANAMRHAARPRIAVTTRGIVMRGPPIDGLVPHAVVSGCGVPSGIAVATNTR